MASLGVLSPNVAWLLCLLIFCCSLPLDICDESEDDRQALLCFKSQLSGPPGFLASWSNEYMELCNWHGVTCSAQPPPYRCRLFRFYRKLFSPFLNFSVQFQCIFRPHCLIGTTFQANQLQGVDQITTCIATSRLQANNLLQLGQAEKVASMLKQRRQS